MARSKTTPLAAARAAVTEGDFAGALAHLVVAWRATPAIELADAIDAIGERAARDVAPPSGKTPKARALAWNAAAASDDPVVRTHLCATITDTKGNADTLARLELLDGCRDPRFASAVVAMLEAPPYNVTVHRTQPFWKYVFARLPELGDARILARARACPARWATITTLNPPEHEMLGKKLAKLLPALEAAYGAPPVLADADRAIVRELVAATRTTGAERAEIDQATALLAAIYANPADDAPRLVYADWLGERGDPRGEFITLQLATERTAKTRAREAALVAEHGVRWLGSIAKYVLKTSIRFERGFLQRCRINTGIDRGALRPPSDPMWSTVEETAVCIPDPAPVLRVAREIGNTQLAGLLDVRRPPPLETIGWSAFDPREIVDAVPLLVQLKLPVLRRIELPIYEPPQGETAVAVIAPLWRELAIAELAVRGDPDELPAWMAAIADSQLLRIELVTLVWNQAKKDLVAWHVGVARDRPRAPFTRFFAAGPPKLAAAEPLDAFAIALAACVEGFRADSLDTIELVLPRAALWKTIPAATRTGLARALERQPRATPQISHHG